MGFAGRLCSKLPTGRIKIQSASGFSQHQPHHVQHSCKHRRQKQESWCRGNKMLMALSGTQDMLILPFFTHTSCNFNRLFLFPIANGGWVRAQYKQISHLTLHCICQEQRLCTAILKTFNIWGTGICFWELLWDPYSSSYTNFTWLSLGSSAGRIFNNILLRKVLHLLSSLMPTLI